MKTCTIDGCSGRHRARGYCFKHYERFRKYGDPLTLERQPQKGRECSIDGCKKPSYSRGYCTTHYQRYRVHGCPSITTRTGNGEALDWLEERITEPFGDDCVEWPFGRGSGGYGQVNKDGQLWKAHRLALTLFSGPPPNPDMVAAHEPIICHNPGCINPKHLRWASRGDNARDRVVDGTDARGEKSARAKLTQSDVRIIRESADSTASLATRFNVAYATVDGIKRGRRWKHL